MPLVLAGATSGQATVQATDAQTVTLTLPASSGTLVVTGGAQTIEFADGSASAPSITNSGDTNTGMFFPAADTIAFTEGGVESMRINASGQVGIGTTNPVVNLQIGASSDVGIAMSNSSSVTSGNRGTLYMYNSGTSTVGYIRFGAVTDNVGTDIQFGIRPAGGSITEAMRIDSSGNAMIGTTSANGKLRVTQTSTSDRTITASAPASYQATLFRSDCAATAATDWYHMYGSSSGGIVNNIFIYGNGNIQNANNSYGAISDIKLKENIVDATPKLDKLMQVKVRNYNLKGEYEQHKQIGVIAQELEQIFPSMIEETQDRDENDELLETTTKSVKYSVFVPMLIKAIQEQQAIITDLKARIETLENT
jgi:hypothetical protein